METIIPLSDRQKTCPLLETKYRDIADGNILTGMYPWHSAAKLETKYRDIADGNITWLVVSPFGEYLGVCVVGAHNNATQM